MFQIIINYYVCMSQDHFSLLYKFVLYCVGMIILYYIIYINWLHVGESKLRCAINNSFFHALTNNKPKIKIRRTRRLDSRAGKISPALSASLSQLLSARAF